MQNVEIKRVVEEPSCLCLDGEEYDSKELERLFLLRNVETKRMVEKTS